MSNRKKIVLILAGLTIPGMIFLNAWQGFRYHELRREVARLEAEQEDLLEKNRNTIARIASARSPAEVEKKAVAAGLVPVEDGRLTVVSVAEKGSR
jgi:hypothetical protein